MKFKKIFLPLVLFLFWNISLWAQPLNHTLNVYMNQQTFNAGASGLSEQQLVMSLVGTYQWAGFRGAPLYSTLWADIKGVRSGLSGGAMVNYEGFGVNSKVGATGFMAYSLPLSKKLKLGMGLNVGYYSQTFNSALLENVLDQDDQLLQQSNTNFGYLRLGLGFHLRSKKFAVGLSSPDFVKTDARYYFNTDTAGFFEQGRNYILHGNYKIYIGDSYTLQLSALGQVYRGYNPMLGVGAQFDIKEFFWVGLNYYTNGRASINAGTYISSRFRLVYSYEMNFGKLSNQLLSTHEINLFFRIDKFNSNK